MNSLELCNYLEKIRYGRNISQDDFVDGVVSIRQYQRYKSGESVIPYEKISQFAEKLGLTSKKLQSEFEKEKSKQYVKINAFYNAVANNDYKNAVKLKNELDNDRIISSEGRQYYNHANIVYKYYSKELSLPEVIERVSKLINYPTILKQQYYTDVEVLILSFLLGVFKGNQQDMLLQRLNSIFEDADNIMSGDSDYIYTLILMRIAKIHGIKKDYPRVIYFCELGLDRGIIHKQYYLWEYFYYFKALSHYALGQRDLYEDSLLKCYHVLQMEGNHSKIEKFTNLIEGDFNINYREFVFNKINPKFNR